VEGERRLARAREPGEHHQLVARDLDVDVLEIVLACATDRDDPAVVGVAGGCSAGVGSASGAWFVEQIVHRAMRIGRSVNYARATAAAGEEGRSLAGSGLHDRSRNIGRTGAVRQPKAALSPHSVHDLGTVAPCAATMFGNSTRVTGRYQ